MDLNNIFSLLKVKCSAEVNVFEMGVFWKYTLPNRCLCKTTLGILCSAWNEYSVRGNLL